MSTVEESPIIPLSDHVLVWRSLNFPSKVGSRKHLEPIVTLKLSLARQAFDLITDMKMTAILDATH